MHKTKCCKVLKIFQHGKYLVAYVLKLSDKRKQNGVDQTVRMHCVVYQRSLADAFADCIQQNQVFC